MSKNKKTLNEDFDFGGDIGFGFGGGAIGSTDDLFKVFVQPFTDIVQTAVAAGLDISNQALGLFKTITGGVMASIVPFVDADYEAIDNETEARANAIKSKYKDVFDRTSAALSDNEFKIIAFALNPAGALLAGAAKVSAKAAKLAKEKGSEAATNAKQALSRAEQNIADLENQFLQLAKQENAVTTKLILTEDKEEKINSSDLAQDMKKDAISAIKNRLEGVFDVMQKVDQATTIEQLQSVMKFDAKILQKLDQIKTGDDQEEVEEQILDDAIEQVKQALIGKLETEMQAFEDLPFSTQEATRLYVSAINTIKSV